MLRAAVCWPLVDGPEVVEGESLMAGLRRVVARVAVLLVIAPLGPLAQAASATTIETAMVSAAVDGYADMHSSRPAMSADGRFVVFESNATNLVIGDTNVASDVFVRDSLLGSTERVSVHSDGSQFEAVGSWGSEISDDGRIVAFLSGATLPGPRSASEWENVFAYDRMTHTLELVSVAGTAEPAPNPCEYGGDYRCSIQLAPEGARPALSADGRYVAFASRSADVVPGDTNVSADVFVRDRVTGVTTRVSVAADGSEADAASSAPDISADGRYVAFESAATNLISGNGAPSPYFTPDIYVKDLLTGVVSRATNTAGDPTAPGPGSWMPSLSADGRVVAFMSAATGLVSTDTHDQSHVYAHDLVNGSTELVSVGPGGEAGDEGSSNPEVSGDGAVVAFRTAAQNILGESGDCPCHTGAAVRNRVTGTTVRADAAPGGEGGMGDVEDRPAISSTGRYLAYSTDASNLGIPDGEPSVWDVYRSDLGWSAQSAMIPAGGTYDRGNVPTVDNPVRTTILTPTSGRVSTSTQPASPSHEGFQMLGWDVVIEAPAATVDVPLSMTFTLVAGLVGGADPASVTPFRDDEPLSNCTESGAIPDPCVTSRSISSAGDLTITVLSSHASRWTFGTANFAFTGFFAPIDNVTVNLATAGSAIPVKFSLGGYRGLGVLAGPPTTIAASCTRGRVDAIEETVRADSPTLRYSATNDEYVYVWKTSRSWAGTCRRFSLQLTDGSRHIAVFSFRP